MLALGVFLPDTVRYCLVDRASSRFLVLYWNGVCTEYSYPDLRLA